MNSRKLLIEKYSARQGRSPQRAMGLDYGGMDKRRWENATKNEWKLLRKADLCAQGSEEQLAVAEIKFQERTTWWSTLPWNV